MKQLWARVRAIRSLDDGAATAEYAITIMAAVGFAGLLVVIMKSDQVRTILSNLVQNALHYGG
jgi:signal transduction histidine kinase